jgi:hypothetical protein
MQQETTIGRIPEASRAAQIGNSLAWTLAALLAFAPGVAGQSQNASAGQVSSVSTAVVTSGTRFLVKLDDKLSTRKDKVGKKFDLKTLEPLIAANGAVIPPNTKITGHVCHLEPAGLTGHARLLLCFDEIRAREGKLPIVADVVGAPSERNVIVNDKREGAIEGRTTKGREEMEAAAAGAVIGAVIGATARNGKGAGIGAAIGGATGFLIASGMGMELELQKGTKLELELSRPLYVEKW